MSKREQWFQKLFKECFNTECQYSCGYFGLYINGMHVFVDKAKNISIKFKGRGSDSLSAGKLLAWLEGQGIKAKVERYISSGSGYCGLAGMPTLSIRGLKDYPWNM